MEMSGIDTVTDPAVCRVPLLSTQYTVAVRFPEAQLPLLDANVGSDTLPVLPLLRVTVFTPLLCQPE